MTRTVFFRRLLLALQHARRQNLQAEGKPAPLTKAQAGWPRRRFIKTTGFAGAAGVVAGGLPLPVRALTVTGFEPAQPVAIVGGGLAGLHAAYQLDKAGISATVYEARRRVGRRILSLTRVIGYIRTPGIPPPRDPVQLLPVLGDENGWYEGDLETDACT